MKMNIRTDRLVIREYIISILIFSVIVFGFLIGTGTLTSGIHLTDDHEFFSIQNEIESEGLGVCKAVEAVISMWLLYVFARKCRLVKCFP